MVFKNFEIRNEFFGALVWDFKNKDFLAFDNDSLKIFKLLNENKSLSEISSLFPNYNISDFISNLEKVGLIKNNTLDANFVNNEVLPGLLSAPARLHYTVTAKCNLNCKHCFTRDILKSELKELTFSEKIKVLDFMDKYGIREMLIGGGEPFCADRFLDFLKEGVKRNISLKVFSNGTIFDDKLIKEISEIPLTYLAISLDGSDKESYQEMRNGDYFDLILENITKLSKSCNYDIVIQVTISKSNMNSIDDFFKIVERTGASKLKLRPLKPGGAILDNNDLLVSSQEYYDVLNKAKHIWNTKGYREKGIKLDYSWGNLRLTCDQGDIDLVRMPQPCVGFGCLGGKVNAFLDAYGILHPCGFVNSFLETAVEDNIRNKDILDIWKTGRNFLYLRNIKGNSECKACNLYSTCRGGCRARAHYYNKDINAKDGWCPKDVGMNKELNR